MTARRGRHMIVVPRAAVRAPLMLFCKRRPRDMNDASMNPDLATLLRDCLADPSRPAPGIEDYRRMIRGKTSALFACCFAGAGELCGKDAGTLAALEGIGEALGEIFQIQDDILDLYGDKGRDLVGADIAEGKRSALVMHSFETLTGGDRERLAAILDTDREATSSEMIASRAPAAPRRCPVIDLVEPMTMLYAWSPSTSLTACVSIASAIVDVPCAFT